MFFIPTTVTTLTTILKRPVLPMVVIVVGLFISRLNNLLPTT